MYICDLELRSGSLEYQSGERKKLDLITIETSVSKEITPYTYQRKVRGKVSIKWVKIFEIYLIMVLYQIPGNVQYFFLFYTRF